MKTLILTEKPSVAMDFAKAIGGGERKDGYVESKNYIITFAVGHLVELFEPENYDESFKKWSFNTLPIIPDKFLYRDLPRTTKQLNIIKKLLENPYEKIIISTDAGREGEVIARTIFDFLGVCDYSNIYRFWSSQALTKPVILEGLQNLKHSSSYDRLWHAGQARQIADWLIGMNVTRAATIKMYSLFSVGRVQTAILGLIVDRKREIENFTVVNYWVLNVVFTNEKGSWKGSWFNSKESNFKAKEKAIAVLNKIKDKDGIVKSVEKKEVRQKPPFLYSLTDLQREANTKFGFTAKKTLDLAQKLYEEYKCLSYPRTDSKVMGTKNVELVSSIISKLASNYPDVFKNLDRKLVTKKNRIFDDDKLTDHHALIPLSKIPDGVSKDLKQIFLLVLVRFSAVFHRDYIFEKTTVITQVEKETFKTVGKHTLQMGWQNLYKEGQDKDVELPKLIQNDPAHVDETFLEKKKTPPPPQYTESLLLKDMVNPARYVKDNVLKKIFRGDAGLGTQATRAQIIETLLKREYVKRIKKTLQATDKGCFLIDNLRNCKNSKSLTYPEDTAKWEFSLEEIAQNSGDVDKFLGGIKDMVNSIVGDFKTGENINKFQVKTIGKCVACKGDVIESVKGFGCSNWKKEDGSCKFVIWKEIAKKNITLKIAKQLLEKGITDEIKGFTSKKGKKFDACLKIIKQEDQYKVVFDFPDNNKKEIFGKCPACGGNIIEGKKGFGCANWKKEDGNCKFVIWKEIAKKEISKTHVKQLLENGITDKITGFISKKGSTFDVGLKIIAENDEFKVVFDF